MDKLTLYKKGGKLFYKDKMGKMCSYEGGGPIRFRLPKFQPYGGSSSYIGDDGQSGGNNNDYGQSSTIQNPYMNKVVDKNVSQDDVKKPKSVFNQIGDYANAAASIVSAFTPNKKFEYDNKYEQQIGKSSQHADSTASGVKSGVTAGIGQIPGWGQAVSGLINMGTGISKAVKNKDKYGISQSDAQDAIGNAISPSESWSDAIKGVAKHGVAGVPDILKNIFLPNIPIASHTAELDRQQVAKAKKEAKWDEDRNAMVNSENTGQTRNDSIYAKHGAYIKKSANVNPNAEIEHGEVVMTPDGMDTNSVTMNPNVNTSMVSDKAFLVKGKTHEEGGETGNFPEGTYIFSDHLGMNGTKARKGEKTVAQLAKPHAKALSQMEKRPNDRYLNNPKAKQYHENQLNQLAEMAEAGKQQANQNQMFKNALKTAKGIYQSGGVLQEYATQKMKVDPSFVKKAVSDDPMNYRFNNPDLYKGREFDSYQDEEVIPAESAELEVNVEEGVDLGTEARQGDRPDITTLDAQAGKSKYSGTSNLIQEKVREMIDDNFFDENGKIAPEWKQKLKSEYDLSDDEVNNATMETITEGRVGKSVGKLLQDAYGVLGKGKDEQSRLVESNVNRKTDRPVINNKLSWADDIVGQIKDNGNILPQQYQSLPDDLKDTLIQLARTGKRASEGSFTPSLDRAYRAANESVASEVDRQKSMTYDTQSQDGAKPYGDYDLYYNRQDGKAQSFGAAFREATQLNLPEFPYKGKMYSTKTRSQDPALAKASDAIKASQSTKPINQLNIQPKAQWKAVVNPTRKLETLQQGGNINNLTYNNMNFKRRPLLSSYQAGGNLPKYQGDPKVSGYTNLSNYDKARYDAILRERNAGNPIAKNHQDWFNSIGQNQMTPTVPNVTPQVNTGIPVQGPNLSYVKSPGYLENKRKADEWDEIQAMKLRDIQLQNEALLESRKPKQGLYNPVTGFKDGKLPTPIMQGGGMMPGQEQAPNESNDHMNQLMSGDPAAMAQEGMSQQVDEQMPADAGQGQMPMQIAELQPQLQQLFIQLSPEQQQQILSLPPDQIEIALMTLAQQMMQGQGGQPQPAQPQMGGVSEVPAGVMEQLG